MEMIENPIDTIEEIMAHHEWLFKRTDDEIDIDIKAQWNSYKTSFTWVSDLNGIFYKSVFNVNVSRTLENEIFTLLNIINQRMWMGSFSFDRDEKTIEFKYTLLLAGQEKLSYEQIEDIVNISLNECERYYPAFDFVLNHGKNGYEALSLALINVEGEA